MGPGNLNLLTTFLFLRVRKCVMFTEAWCYRNVFARGPPLPNTSQGVDPPEGALSPRRPHLTPPTVVGGDKLKKPTSSKILLFVYGVRQNANRIKRPARASIVR